MNFSLLCINTNITLTFPETQSFLYSNQSHWKRIGREEREKEEKEKKGNRERKEIKNQLIHTCTYKYTTITMQKLKHLNLKPLEELQGILVQGMNLREGEREGVDGGTQGKSVKILH